jgi:Lon protease-like protein
MRSACNPGSQLTELPLFALRTVLFPGGRLALRVFEKRYRDMLAVCLKQDRPFGFCLIGAGDEVGSAAEPHAIGTSATVSECNATQSGILQIVVRGGWRFRVARTRVQPDQLIMAEVEPLPAETAAQVDPAYHGLRDLLAGIIAQLGDHFYVGPVKLDDALWVAYRLAEFLPLTNALKQALLEETGANRKLGLLAVGWDRVAERMH